MGSQNEQMRALLDSSRAISSTVVLEEVLRARGRAGGPRPQARRPATSTSTTQLNDSIVWRSHYQARRLLRGRPIDLGTAYPLDDFPWDRAVLRSGQPVARDRRGRRAWTASCGPACGNGVSRACSRCRSCSASSPWVSWSWPRPAHPRRFSAEEIDLAKAIGEQAAIAIRNAQLYRRETWRNERLVRVLEISRAVGSSLDATQVIEGLQAQVGPAVRRQPGRRHGASSRTRPPSPTEKSLPAGVGRARRHGAPAARAAAGAPRAPSIVSSCRWCRRATRSATSRSSAAARAALQTDEVELVQLLANQAAASVDNARLYETIERQAITDGLTGLYNHRHFFQCLRSEVTRARRYGFSLSVLMLDLDDFKSFNDRFGHPAGDRVLRAVADILRAQLRQEIDVPARYGGEEFAVILPHTPWPGAQTVGERITSSLGALDEAQPTERRAHHRRAGPQVHRRGAPAAPRRRSPRPRHGQCRRRHAAGPRRGRRRAREQGRPGPLPRQAAGQEPRRRLPAVLNDRSMRIVGPRADDRRADMCDAEAATTDHNHSYALKDSDDGDAAVVADTLLALTEQIAVALDCSECCIYEYLPEREALCAQAIWGRN